MLRLQPRAQHAPRSSRRRRLALFGGVAFAVVAAAGFFLYWEVFRDRQPPIEGEIDESALTEPTLLCVREVEPPCRSMAEAERLLDRPDLVIRGAEQTSGGNQGVIALALETPDGARFKVKWRSHGSSSLFNVPAKELAAYRLQALVLDPADYVVPPTASHCFDADHYEEQVLEAAPLEGTSCVFGFASYWLTGAITMPEARRRGFLPMPPDGPGDDDPQLFDAARFDADPTYRRNIAALNLITHLVNNRDAHAGQFVLYREPWHVFLIDSSLAFHALPNPRTFFIQDLSELIVPAIPSDVADRLRALERRDVDSLMVIEELAEDDGRLVAVAPGPAIDTDTRFRRAGGRLQLGLTAADIDGLWERIVAVRARLRDGRLETF